MGAPQQPGPPLRPASGPGRCPGWRSAAPIWPGSTATRHGQVSSSNSRCSPWASCSPLGVPAPALTLTVGSWSSLATMPRVRASTAAAWAGSSPASRLRKRASSPARIGLAPLVQGGDQRGHLTLGRHVQVALDLLGHDGLGPGNLLTAAGHGDGGRRGEVVHVQQGHARQGPDGRVDVPGHGDVDDQQRPSLPGRQHRLQVGGHQQDVRRARWRPAGRRPGPGRSAGRTTRWPGLRSGPPAGWPGSTSG